MLSALRKIYWRLRRRPSRSQPQTYKPVILVTGCGSGIGRALAFLLYERSEYRVVVTCRRASLAALRRALTEGDRFWIRELDVTDESGRTALVTEITDAWGGVDILVNNAGIAYRAVVEHMAEADEKRQMATNYLGPAALIRLVLPHMREVGRGKIINVSSVSGMLAMPTMASYSASKYALEGMSEALWYEARPLGINVSLIQPGFIRSDSFRRVCHTGQSNPRRLEDDEAYADYYRNMAPFVERLMNASFATSQSVARVIIKAIRQENPPLWIPATADASGFYFLRRLLPRRLLLPILFYALPGARHWARRYTKSRAIQGRRKRAA